MLVYKICGDKYNRLIVIINNYHMVEIKYYQKNQYNIFRNYCQEVIKNKKLKIKLISLIKKYK